MDINIIDYGAVVSADLQTEIIQKAIDDCFLSGGGKVMCKNGDVRLSNNCCFRKFCF